MDLKHLPLLAAPLALAACQQPAYDPRGVDHDETLLSVSATGESEPARRQAMPMRRTSPRWSPL